MKYELEELNKIVIKIIKTNQLAWTHYKFEQQQQTHVTQTIK